MNTEEIARTHPDHALFFCLMRKGDEFESLGPWKVQHFSKLWLTTKIRL